MRSCRLLVCWISLHALVSARAAPLLAQQTPRAGDGATGSAGPRRSADGRLEIPATLAEEPVRIDGILDEAVWGTAPTVGGFVQAEPSDGAPATESTVVRVAYDADNLYIAAVLYERDPRHIVVNDIRKDFAQEDQDVFEVILDTFGDRRNGYVFSTNPEGARADRQVSNEGREVNASWDAVWTVRTRRTRDGWTAEMAIPFRALRFEKGTGRTWGVNFSRHIRYRNEIDFWSPVPRAYTLSRLSLAGNLVGLEPSTAGRDLRIKPYLAARTVRETTLPGVTTPPSRFDRSADVGLDLKLGVTQGLTLDLTANPDFAQAEADEQQVNLTQFDQFFPEKRDFFLENSGIFYVGDAARNRSPNPTPTPDEDLLLFFSRRIGLTPDGREIPIAGGVRLTGRAAGFNVGALTMQTRHSDTVEANNYAVLRLRRNLRAGSDVGAIAMMRQNTDSTADYNRVYGVDANIRFFGTIDWNSYLVRTETPGFGRGQNAARTSLNHEGNFLHAKGGVMTIGEGFNDDLGYFRRTGVRKWFADLGIRPRPTLLNRHGVREMHPHVVWNYYEDLSGRMVAKWLHTGYTFFFNNGGFAELSLNPNFERLTEPLEIDEGVPPIPAGGYGWNEWQLRFNTDPSRALSASFTGIRGGLWSGTQRSAFADVTVRPSYRFRLSAGIQRTDADLPAPSAPFVATLWTMRTNYSFSTRMFLDALSQYDPEQRLLNANVRFNLIHHPLSDLFIVLNEQRFITADRLAPGRSVIVKLTHMVAL